MVEARQADASWTSAKLPNKKERDKNAVDCGGQPDGNGGFLLASLVRLDVLYSTTGQRNAAWVVKLSFLCHSAFQYQAGID